MIVVAVLFLPPLVFGAALAWYWGGRMRLLVLGLCAAGLAVGALSGTTSTHAFDILWWWKGALIAFLLCVGALVARLVKKLTKKDSSFRW